MKCLAQAPSLELQPISACEADDTLASDSAASMYPCATSEETPRNSTLLRKPSDSVSSTKSFVAAATAVPTPETCASRSCTVLRYSALLKRRSGAAPGAGLLHASEAKICSGVCPLPVCDPLPALPLGPLMPAPGGSSPSTWPCQPTATPSATSNATEGILDLMSAPGRRATTRAAARVVGCDAPHAVSVYEGNRG